MDMIYDVPLTYYNKLQRNGIGAASAYSYVVYLYSRVPRIPKFSLISETLVSHIITLPSWWIRHSFYSASFPRVCGNLRTGGIGWTMGHRRRMAFLRCKEDPVRV